MAKIPDELNIRLNLDGVREELQRVMTELRLTIDEFNKVWLPIEQAIGLMTWPEIQEVFPSADRSELWRMWEAAADKYQDTEGDTQ